VATRLEAKGSPRPSAMTQAQRSSIVTKLRAEAAGGPPEAR
jgi:hypothetical protein